MRSSFIVGIDLRLLRPGDENVVRALRTYDGDGDPEGLLADPRTLFLVAFDGDQPVGFVLAHDLPRRHGDPSNLFVYEVDVATTHRRRGIASALLARLAELARERGIRGGFLTTEPENEAANALYGSIGGVSQPDVLWVFEYGAGRLG
jgi:ribosomal protein S18 acetylase RimI-like enzyme